MSHNTVEITATNFDSEVLKSEKPILVDFWAGWCQPCLAIAPILEDLAGENAEKLTIGKLDVDQPENSQLAAEYGISAIPALLLFVDGKVVKTLTGARPKHSFEQELAEYL